VTSPGYPRFGDAGGVLRGLVTGASGDVDLFPSGCSEDLLVEGRHGRAHLLGGGEAEGVGEADRPLAESVL
jgi:hypothetical protein